MPYFKFATLLLIPVTILMYKFNNIENTNGINVGKANEKATNIIFQSVDNGQTWQDISGDLPTGWEAAEMFTDENGIYLSNANDSYYSDAKLSQPKWSKESFLAGTGHLAKVKSNIIKHHFSGQIIKKMIGTDVWTLVYTTFKEENIRTVFGSTSGSVFIGCDKGLFKSTDDGLTWKQVHNEGWVIRIVESKGVIIATGVKGIMRSADDGNTWQWVISESGVGIAVESIPDGFAAITYNESLKSRKIRTSHDGGATWQLIDNGIRPDPLISSIQQVGKYYFCGHPDGILRSADQGKTWHHVLSPIGKKVFNIYTLGNVIYAVPQNGGC